MSAEKEFQEWIRQLAMRAAANDMREERMNLYLMAMKWYNEWVDREINPLIEEMRDKKT